VDAGGSALDAPKTGALDAPLSADAIIRPWRTATVVASLVAAVELIALMVLAFALLAKPIARSVQHHAEAAALAPPAEKTAVVQHRALVLSIPKHARSQLGVVVLNGNGRSGAAAGTASTLGSLGYHIRGTSNAKRQNYATSVVMYKRGYAPEGARLARDLHVKVVGPLDGLKPAALDGGQLVVILGAR
jgi:LytR cell envelope-related transcriptional attenuator